MSADPRPNTHAVIAHLPDEQAKSSALSALRDEVGLDTDLITHGTGPEFAARVNASEEDDEDTSRIGKWLLSLGQEREELVELAENVKEGRHGIVINEVDERSTLDRIVEVLNRFDAQDIVYFGQWQTEDMSIRRGG